MKTAQTFLDFRRAFVACVDCAERQIGLRRIRDAIALGDRNAERTAELLASLPSLLAYAQERTRRAA